MCGIAGLLIRPGTQRGHQGAIDAMTSAVAHRGPDASGIFADLEAGVALGHRRLSIVDLSPTGAQPMKSVSERFVIVLNGEIYNFKDIRKDLEDGGVGPWRGTSDTEVLLNAIETWGIDAALKRCEGMFAFALWNKGARELTLARDRFGEKPLFIAHINDGLLFASELRAIMVHPAFVGEDEDEAIDQFLALSYIPEPKTPFRNVWKLQPGCYITVRPGDTSFTPKTYWSAADSAFAAKRSQALSPFSQQELIERIEDRLSVVIRNQMIADVPLGAFLSGGIDSSLIVALMQKSSTRPVRTFTIGFEDAAYDEAPFARLIAQYLGTDHTEIMVTWQDALDLVSRLPDIYDEPFADSSQLPTSLVCRGAGREVTVALTGDAGDEVFGGYNRHRAAMSYERFSAAVPAPARRVIASVLAGLSESRMLDTIERSVRALGARRHTRLVGEKMSKLSSFLSNEGRLEIYQALVRRDAGLAGSSVVSGCYDASYRAAEAEGFRFAEIMMLIDTLTYLPGDILTKVDRASMAVALETRAPFLDHHLFDLAWRMPIDAKIHQGKTKNILRTLLSKHLPTALFERSKAGFGAPIGSWLRGPLKDWMLTHLTDFKRERPMRAAMADQAWAAFNNGDPTIHHLLWNIAMLQAWNSNRRKPRNDQAA
jgi:asparagine synthase (glutamine-hydrolysing)